MHGEWEKRCLCACNVGLMSWTVCHPPTAVSERSVLSFRKTAASPHNLLSLYFAQQDAAAFPSPPATNPTRNPDGAHTQTPARTHKRRHALHRGTIKTSQSIRESETWKAFWKFELFLSSLLATLNVFTCLPSPGRGFDKRCASKIGFMIIWLWGIRCVFVSSAISELCFHSYAFLYNSLNNKEQPVNPHTEYTHWTLRVPLHRLQL